MKIKNELLKSVSNLLEMEESEIKSQEPAGKEKRALVYMLHKEGYFSGEIAHFLTIKRDEVSIILDRIKRGEDKEPLWIIEQMGYKDSKNTLTMEERIKDIALNLVQDNEYLKTHEERATAYHSYIEAMEWAISH